MKKLALFGILAVAGAATSANAFEFRVRFVERVGNVDTVIAGNTIDATNGAVRNIRIQFGVFDDAVSVAPEGGYVGWNVGTIAVSGAESNSDERRNNGRLSPFNFAGGPNANGNAPLPAGDPFTMLTEIDNTLGTQSPLWVCDAQGNVPAQPAAAVRGRNTFVSTFAFSIDPTSAASLDYTITIGGNAIGAASWLTVGTATPPDCGDPADPADDQPGSVIYAPFPTAPVAISATLNVLATIPGPGAAALLGLGGLLAARRRR
ncbi:MAG: hypothetical protein H7210_08510 [Pyrinomonadaceae bacterium]|nr:hypothetical protein [Phycisphaerales bacterium]